MRQNHTYHIHGSEPITPVQKYIEYYSRHVPSKKANQIRRAVKSTILEMNQLDIIHALADLLAQNAGFIREFDELKKKPNYLQQFPIVQEDTFLNSLLCSVSFSFIIRTPPI